MEEAIQFDPAIRLICLKRPREEVIAGFCRSLDHSMRFPTNHWAREPASGWSHDFLWTRVFPQYNTQDREEGIGRYWDEYYQKVDDLVRRYPENLRPLGHGCLDRRVGRSGSPVFCWNSA